MYLKIALGCRATVAALALIILQHSASAKATCPANFPSKPIRFVIGFAPGGGTDVIGRGVASGFERIQGWVAPVENRPGAGGGVLMSWLKGQTPDGYTIGVTSSDALTINPAIGNSDYVWSDFDYLGSGMQTWSGLVALKDKPFNNLAELVDFAKKNGRATISVAGVNQEIIVKQLAEQYKVNIVGVPGTGAAEAMTAALGSHVDATMQGTLHVAQIKSGKMKQIASLIDRRVPYAPESGTLPEQGANATILQSYTLVVIPKGMPDDIKNCLVEAVNESVKSAEYKSLMDKFDNEALNLGPDGVRKVLDRYSAAYKELLGSKK